MVARNTHKEKPKRLSNYWAAKVLGVSKSHLGRVLRGVRSSKSLMDRYQRLLAEHAIK